MYTAFPFCTFIITVVVVVLFHVLWGAQTFQVVTPQVPK